MADGASRRGFKRLFRNWLSWAGIVLGAGALFAFLLLLAIDQFAGHRNPYVGCRLQSYRNPDLYFDSSPAGQNLAE